MTSSGRMTGRTAITGVLLAGGKSRRMFAAAGGAGRRSGDTGTGDRGSGDTRSSEAGSGQAVGDAPGTGDKGLLDIAGKPMLGHVLTRLAPQVGRMVLNANGDPARYSAFGLPVVADTVGGFVGPLAGVLAGMRWSAREAPEVSHIVTVSTDAPFIPADLVDRLVEAIADDRPGFSRNGIAMAASGGELHPVIGLWPVALADDLEAALTNGIRKVVTWTDHHGTIPVAFAPVAIGGELVDPFFNANTPEELALARRLLGA